MKKVLLIFLVISSQICFSQETEQDEIIILLNNYSGEVIATATKLVQVGKWYPWVYPLTPWQLITDTEFDRIESNNWDDGSQGYSGRIIFDTEYDQNRDKTLALSAYKISFSGNKTATFYVDVLHSTTYGGYEDRKFTYNYGDDIIYYGECPQCTELYPNDITYIYEQQTTALLEDFWDNCMYYVKENGYPLKVHWGRNPDIETVSYYKIYRTFGICDMLPDGGTEKWIGTVSGDVKFFVDNSYTVGDGSTQFIYKVKAFNSQHQGTDFSNELKICGNVDWSQNLFLTNDNGSLRLVWGPYFEGTISGFKVYRKVGGGSFTQVGSTLSSSTYEWTDPDYGYEPNGVSIQYYVTAVLQSSEDPTNTVSTSGIQMGKELFNQSSYDFSLSSNYPNPFNPMTTIEYSVSDLTLVDLRIYNNMGEEIAVLVSEQKAAGNYSVQFNAFNLPSGIYFYRLQAGRQSLVKNMVLLK